eukprot:TRINITY_DN7474_c0_g1_i1.p1 TRINITY_DN7474_c0_g1~~TRINITY_DN7474_c0_g1_i1.p1  ORF type:complete len:226 (+),score=28.50 TRINITY_DN7474_c0_g1_i1:45-722(+)
MRSYCVLFLNPRCHRIYRGHCPSHVLSNKCPGARNLSLDSTSDPKSWFKSVEEQHKITSPDLWYTVKQSQLSADFRTKLKRFYAGSLLNAVRDNYPSHEWLEWKFLRAPRGFWKKVENRRRFFDRLVVSKWPEIVLAENDSDYRAQLSEKVHSITKEDVYKAGGGSMLLHVYHDSIVDAVHELYGRDTSVKVWKFSKVPANFWDSAQNRRNFFREIAPRLGVSTM